MAGDVGRTNQVMGDPAVNQTAILEAVNLWQSISNSWIFSPDGKPHLRIVHLCFLSKSGEPSILEFGASNYASHLPWMVASWLMTRGKFLYFFLE